MPDQSSAKILFYTDSTYFSGAEKSFSILFRTFRENGGEATLVVSPNIAEEFSGAIGDSGKEHFWPVATRSKLSVGWYLKLRQFLQEYNPDVMVVNMWSPYANTLALLAARSLSIPVMGIYHYYQEKSQVTGVLSPLKLWAYRFNEKLQGKIATVSKKHRSVLIEQFAFPENKTTVLFNAVPGETDGIDYTDHEPRKLLAIGSLEPAKEYDFLLEVLKKVEVPWELTVVGDGPERAKLEEMAADITHGTVHFEGKQKDVAKYYLNADVLVHPSSFENLSMAIIESMSFGLTAIANEVGGNSELIMDGESGWLLPLRDGDAWQKALIHACTTDLSKRRKEAHARWKKMFTPQAQYEAFIQLLKGLDKPCK